MKAQIPWLRVFVEGVVIVASILLAFGLQAWWEGVQEREEERATLERLAAEFGVVDSVLGQWQANHKGVAEASEVLLQHTAPPRTLVLFRPSEGVCLRPPAHSRMLDAVCSRSAPVSDPVARLNAALEGRYAIERRFLPTARRPAAATPH